MKISLLVRVGFVLLSCLPVKAAVGDNDFGISSTRDVDLLTVQLKEPGEQVQALTKLIKFAGRFLCEGSVIWSTDNRKRDDLCRYATRSLRAHHDQHLVVLALKDSDEQVRFWGVMSFEFTYGLTQPWEPFLPQLENIALHDESENIRALAIERLRSYDKEQPFLERLRRSNTEDSPDVLMRLYDFDSTNLEMKNEFYLRAVHFLSSPKESQRLNWLNYIYFDVWNPSTAPMWRFEANDALVKKLKEIATSGASKERDIAQKILVLLKSGHRN